MPWKDANIMELRIQFITDWLKRTHTVSDLCTLGPGNVQVLDRM